MSAVSYGETGYSQNAFLPLTKQMPKSFSFPAKNSDSGDCGSHQLDFARNTTSISTTFEI
jgi:hypothetical protein